MPSAIGGGQLSVVFSSSSSETSREVVVVVVVAKEIYYNKIFIGCIVVGRFLFLRVEDEILRISWTGLQLKIFHHSTRGVGGCWDDEFYVAVFSFTVVVVLTI